MISDLDIMKWKQAVLDGIAAHPAMSADADSVVVPAMAQWDWVALYKIGLCVKHTVAIVCGTFEIYGW